MGLRIITMNVLLVNQHFWMTMHIDQLDQHQTSMNHPFSKAFHYQVKWCVRLCVFSNFSNTCLRLHRFNKEVHNFEEPRGVLTVQTPRSSGASGVLVHAENFVAR